MKSQGSIREMIANNQKKKKGLSDKIVPIILAIIAIISILTTIGILVTLLTETITFFTRVPLTEFLFTKIGIHSHQHRNTEFGH